MEETTEIKKLNKKQQNLPDIATGNQSIIIGVRELILLSISYAISLTLIKIFESVFKLYIGKNLQNVIIYNILFLLFLILIAVVVFLSFKDFK
jgi:hypothetical protein